MIFNATSVKQNTATMATQGKIAEADELGARLLKMTPTYEITENPTQAEGVINKHTNKQSKAGYGSSLTLFDGGR